MIEEKNNSPEILKFKDNKIIYYLIIFFSVVGLADTLYLTSRYYKGIISCSIIEGCQEVLISKYSHFGPVPVSLLGTSYYVLILLASILFLKYRKNIFLLVLKIFSPLAFIFSLWLLYVQIFLIKYICQYCLLSTATSTILFICSLVISGQKKRL